VQASQLSSSQFLQGDEGLHVFAVAIMGNAAAWQYLAAVGMATLHQGSSIKQALFACLPGKGHPGTSEPYGVTIDDVIILPLVLSAVAIKTPLQATFSILIHILDYTFPIFLQLARFPLFTIRIIGDGVSAFLKAVVGFVPMSRAKRKAWREAVTRQWSRVRQMISYRAFEEAVHQAFEGGMAWVFRKCEMLTPRDALLVLVGAIVWLPVSFGVATATHVVLIAEATSLPPWMQLLHPVVTLLAKSKILVLPVYPAAWPQAKKHPLVQTIFRSYQYITHRRLVQKTAYRYSQAERAAVKTAHVVGHVAARTGLCRLSNSFFAGLNTLARRTRPASRTAIGRAIENFSRAPFIGPIIERYAEYYNKIGEPNSQAVSEQVRGFFSRWSIKFTPEYYKAKQLPEVAEASPRHNGL